MPDLLTYNRRDGVAYAEKWALSRNPSYYNFEKIGGDCTNFISQCIYAGAKRMNYTPTFGWYYHSVSSRSPSWTGVIFLNHFLLTNHSAGPHGATVESNLIEPGDIIQLQNEDGRIYHSLYVLTTDNTILVAAHDDDSLYRSLNSYTYANAIFIKITGVWD